jgi:hypothetical protein
MTPIMENDIVTADSDARLRDLRNLGRNQEAIVKIPAELYPVRQDAAKLMEPECPDHPESLSIA